MNLISKLQSQLRNVPLGLLLCLCAAHCCNDILQAVITALYPILKSDLALDFAQIGLVTLVYQLAASIFQPIVGYFFDKNPKPYSLFIGMSFTTAGMIMLAFSCNFHWLLLTVGMVGVGSSILHPEASRITSICSRGRRGLAQSVFQVGGNFGSAVGPLMVAIIVAPHTRTYVLWFLVVSALAFAAMSPIVKWFRGYIKEQKAKTSAGRTLVPQPLSRRGTILTIGVLMILIISKYTYMACMTSYYTFFVIENFGVSVSMSQILLFVFVVATAAGTLLGGPFGDRYGRKLVIWVSIAGTAPFSLLLPHLPLAGVIVCSFMAGFILSSAFPAILLYSQELLPNHLGLVSGLFFGFAFGMGGVASAVIGNFADIYGIDAVFSFCAWTPLFGLIAVFLPNLKLVKRQ